jgi:hypothetical protein
MGKRTMWHTSLFSAVGGVSFIPMLPGREYPPISFARSTDLRAGLGVVNREIPSYFSNKPWCPSQLGHNLVNILTQLTQPLFIKIHNVESRTHGHPYFLMVCTDMHAHTLTQINTWLEKTTAQILCQLEWSRPKQVVLTKQRAPSMLETF